MVIKNLIKNIDLEKLKKIDENIQILNKKNKNFDILITSSIKRSLLLLKKNVPYLIILINKKNIKVKNKKLIQYKSINSFLNDKNFITYINLFINTIKLSNISKLLNKIKYSSSLKKIKQLLNKLDIKVIKVNNKKIIDYYNKINCKIIIKNKKIKGFFIKNNKNLYYFYIKDFNNSILNKKSIKQIYDKVKNTNFFSKTKICSLKEKEHFFANHINESFFIQRLDGKIIYYNTILKNLFQMNNINENEIQSFFKKNIISNLNIQKNNNLINHKIVLNLFPDKYFEISYFPIIENGILINYCGIIRDVTENKKMELELQISKSNLEKFNRILTSVQHATILGFSKLAEYKDKETGGHLDRIQNYVKVLSIELKRMEIFIDFETKKNYITDEYIEELSFSSLLHDIGKMGIPDHILQKPGKLEPEEFEIMKKHTEIGGNTLKWLNDMVGEITFLSLAKDIAYYHHEKWNGTGYPFGLQGEKIPLSARIVSICDVYDALTSKRSYKESFTHEKACELIYNNAGSYFDPVIVSAFSSIESNFRIIRSKFS